ncbi:MAG: TetR/AcrR family transcriptional regulator [Deltaproteobacteria bacterium]|nr:MAG: TetR/AcrR family transcriptional regulator [Deltaproteobacteria bacterium]
MARRLTALQRRQQLIRIGRQVFAEHGFEGTTVEEIARRAKVSKPIIYEHFGGKEGLYAVVVDRDMEAIVGRISQAIGQGSPRERLEAAVLAFLTWVRDEPDAFMLLLRDSPTSRGSGMAGLLHDLADRVGTVFNEQFTAAGFDKRLAPLYAHALVGMVTFVGEWWIEARKPPVEVVAAHVAALAWMGLRHLPAKPALSLDP